MQAKRLASAALKSEMWRHVEGKCPTLTSLLPARLRVQNVCRTRVIHGCKGKTVWLLSWPF